MGIFITKMQMNWIIFLLTSFFDSKYSTLEQTKLSSLYYYTFDAFFFFLNYCLDFGPGTAGDEVPKKTNRGSM